MKNLLNVRDIIRGLWYYVCRYILVVLSDQAFFRLLSWITFRRLGFSYYKMNFKQPTSFNEKLNYLKQNKNDNLYTLVADKYGVRDYVKDKIGSRYLIPLIGIYNNVKEVPFDQLPNAFVLKANHGSGWNILCRSKEELDVNDTKKKLNRWLSYNAFYLSRERQYKNINPLIVCEEMLGYNIYDYKFFCFHGTPRIIQVDIGRFTNHTRAFFNSDWELQPYSIRYPIYNGLIPKPSCFDEMLSVAKILSADFIFSRIDLYVHENNIYFGEITLCPGGGFEPFTDNYYDFEVGKYLDIDIDLVK